MVSVEFRQNREIVNISHRYIPAELVATPAFDPIYEYRVVSIVIPAQMDRSVAVCVDCVILAMVAD
jgi:hypothetical protein